MHFDPTLVTLSAAATVRDDRLVVDYQLRNASSSTVYACNRFPEARVHRGSLQRFDYTMSSAHTFLLSNGELLMFQGQEIEPEDFGICANPPAPLVPGVAASIVSPGATQSARIELALPLEQARGGMSSEPLQGQVASRQFWQSTSLVFALELRVQPASSQEAGTVGQAAEQPWWQRSATLPQGVEELDGTDAVLVVADRWWRIVQRLALPRPIRVELSPLFTRWGDEHMRIIREGRAHHEGFCSYPDELR